MARAMGNFQMDFSVRQYSSPLTARGFVRYVRLRIDQESPQSWVCDECFARVTSSKMSKHADDHSRPGFGGR